jgi:HlyD family secretion protein
MTRRVATLVLTLSLVAVLAFLLLGRERAVPAARVTTRDVTQTVVASGRVLVAGDVELGVKAPGRVREVTVREGEHVAAGQVLVKLDATESEAALSEARASVLRSLVEVRRVRQKATPLAQVSLKRAEVDVEYSEQELGRIETLSKQGALSAQQLEQARNALSLARTRRDAAQVELSSSMPAGADRELAVAALRQAQAALEVAESRLGDAMLVAPKAATVVLVDVDAGEAVQPGRVLVRLVLDGPVQLEMEPDERNLALLHVGQAARASAEAFPEQSFEAKLSYIASAVDADRGTVKVRLDVPAPPAYLRADMTVSIEVLVREVQGALVVPALAVRELTGKPWVMVADGDRAQRRDVSVGARDERFVQIASGVSEGELLLLDPQLEAGTRVTPREEAR